MSQDLVRRFRHKKRGTEYVLIGVGRMQAEHWRYQPFGAGVTSSFDGSVDMREVAIYRSVDDCKLWVRPSEEFEDGRFEELPSYEAASLIEASAGNAEPVGDEHAEAQFTEWFVKNYPGPDTVIHKPTWHAPKIFRAARHALRSATPPALEASAPEAVKALDADLLEDFREDCAGDGTATFPKANLRKLIGEIDRLATLPRPAVSEAMVTEAVKADRIVPSGLSMKDGAIFVSFDTDEEAQIAYDALEEGVPFVATLPRPAVSEAMARRLMVYIWEHSGRPGLIHDPRLKAEYRFNGVDMLAALQAALGGEEG